MFPNLVLIITKPVESLYGIIKPVLTTTYNAYYIQCLLGACGVSAGQFILPRCLLKDF